MAVETHKAVCGWRVSRSVARSALANNFASSPKPKNKGGFTINRKLKFSIPGLTCRRQQFLLFRSYFCEGEPRFSIRMLWKLADNVKYEDDCEVSVEGSRLQREAEVFLINTGQQFDVER